MSNFSDNLTPLFRPPFPHAGGPSPSPSPPPRKLYPPPSIPSIKNYFLTEHPENKVLCFQSKDGKHLSVELPIAMQMQYFRKSYEGENFVDRSKIEVDFVYGDILAYVLYFCMVKCKVEEGILRFDEAEGLCFGFVEKFYILQDVRTIYNVLEAATALQVDLLRDLLCEIIVKMVHESTPETVSQVFDVDITFRDPTRIDNGAI